MPRSQNDSWAEFVIRAVQEEARARQLPVDFILSRHIEALREMVPPGRPDEEARSMLFETAAAIACDYDAGLALPPRDDSRGLTSTPLFEFGAAMVDLVVDYATRCWRGNSCRRGASMGSPNAKVVVVDQLPIPPLSSWGLTRFADFERGNFNGITYLDTFFLRRSQSRNEAIHFHELIHVIQWRISGQNIFYDRMPMVWNASDIETVHWKSWPTMPKRHSRLLRLHSTQKSWLARR